MMSLSNKFQCYALYGTLMEMPDTTAKTSSQVDDLFTSHYAVGLMA